MNISFKGSHSQYLLILLIAVLSGCGGGGGGSSSGSASPSTPVSPSSNAFLSDVTLSDAELDQTFQSSQFSYTVAVNFLTHSTTVTPTTDDAKAAVTVNNEAVVSGDASEPIALSEGLTAITVVVTAEDGTATNTYSVEVTRQTADSYAQLSSGYLKASNAEARDRFGSSIAFSGDMLAVGAPGKSIYGTYHLLPEIGPFELEDAGAAYVFNLSNGIWTQQAYLRASNADGGFSLIGGGGDVFGSSIAISGDTLAVGAPGEASNATDGENDNSAFGAGAVYVFTRNNGVWTQDAYLKASSAKERDNFGSSVAISGDTLVVGVPREDSSVDGASDAGAVYVFTRTNGVWTQDAYLKASNAEGGDYFGSSVAISGDTLAVGAPNQGQTPVFIGMSIGYRPGAGAVYVFTRANGAWTQDTLLKASNGERGDDFGDKVALSGDTLAIGAFAKGTAFLDGGEVDYSAHATGAVYVFARIDTVWTQQDYLKASNAEGQDQFGRSIALSGDILAVGALLEDSSATGGEADNSAVSAGAAYVFTRTGNLWTQQIYFKASNAEANDLFGYSVAISGDTVVVGASREGSSATGGEADNSAGSAGAAYVFQ